MTALKSTSSPKPTAMPNGPDVRGHGSCVTTLVLTLIMACGFATAAPVPSVSFLELGQDGMAWPGRTAVRFTVDSSEPFRGVLRMQGFRPSLSWSGGIASREVNLPAGGHFTGDVVVSVAAATSSKGTPVDDPPVLTWRLARSDGVVLAYGKEPFRGVQRPPPDILAIGEFPAAAGVLRPGRLLEDAEWFRCFRTILAQRKALAGVTPAAGLAIVSAVAQGTLLVVWGTPEDGALPGDLPEPTEEVWSGVGGHWVREASVLGGLVRTTNLDLSRPPSREHEPVRQLLESEWSLRAQSGHLRDAKLIVDLRGGIPSLPRVRATPSIRVAAEAAASIVLLAMLVLLGGRQRVASFPWRTPALIALIVATPWVWRVATAKEKVRSPELPLYLRQDDVGLTQPSVQFALHRHDLILEPPDFQLAASGGPERVWAEGSEVVQGEGRTRLVESRPDRAYVPSSERVCRLWEMQTPSLTFDAELQSDGASILGRIRATRPVETLTIIYGGWFRSARGVPAGQWVDVSGFRPGVEVSEFVPGPVELRDYFSMRALLDVRHAWPEADAIVFGRERLASGEYHCGLDARARRPLSVLQPVHVSYQPGAERPFVFAAPTRNAEALLPERVALRLAASKFSVRALESPFRVRQAGAPRPSGDGCWAIPLADPTSDMVVVAWTETAP